MSFTALAWASKQKTGNGTTKLILLCLANYADDKNSCFPSFKTICLIKPTTKLLLLLLLLLPKRVIFLKLFFL